MGYSTLSGVRFIGPMVWVRGGGAGFSTLILPGIEVKRRLDWASDCIRYSFLPVVGFIVDVMELGN